MLLRGRDIMDAPCPFKCEAKINRVLHPPAAELIEITHPHLKLFVAASIGDGDDDESGND